MNTCTATQHGTPNAYNRHGCRCPSARERYRIYRKRLRHGLQPAAMVAAHGATRRLAALNAIGWPTADLAPLVGISAEMVKQHIRGEHQSVSRVVDQRIRDTYERLSGTPGPSRRCRDIARAKGTPPPLAWDDDDIDDPNAKPNMGEDAPAVIVDDIAVERALGGDRKVVERMRPAEIKFTVLTGLSKGIPAKALSRDLGLPYTMVEATSRRMRRERAAA